MQSSGIRVGERRRHSRIPLEGWAEVTVGTTTSFCRTADISESGLFLTADCPFPPGSLVEVKLTVVEGGSPVSMRGLVVEHRKSDRKGMGVVFTNLAPHERITLRGLIGKLEAREGVWVELGV